MFLYDSEAIRRKLQSVLASKHGRRYALVAFVGQDALDFVAEPRGLIVYCWDNVSATHPDGIRALIGEGDYNEFRPHKSLGNRTPEEFVRELQATPTFHLSAA